MPGRAPPTATLDSPRYYALTPAGRARLRADAATWRRYAEAVLEVLEPSRPAQGVSPGS